MSCYCSSSLCQQHGWLLPGILTRELSKMPSKGGILYFSQGALEWFAFTSQSLVAYLLSQWSCGGVFGGWMGGKSCITAFSTKPTHPRTALSSVFKKIIKIQYVNLQGTKWNLGIYLICIKRQKKKDLGLCIFHYPGPTLPIYAQCFVSAVISVGKLFKMQESGSDMLMAFHKKWFTAKDKQTLSVQPQCEKGQDKEEVQQ